MEAPAIGIDLGTTYCCVAVYHKGKVHVIPNQEHSGELTTPSYVFLDTDGDVVVGHPAKSDAHRNPDNTIYDVKRILGREFNNRELQNDMKFWPFTVQKGEQDIPMVKVNGELRYPEEISALLLAKMKSFAEKYLQLKPGAIKKAVITVPAYFHDGQRQATIDAGELAGLEVLTILNEPTAAAIAYSMERTDTKPKKILVFDLGGGTFDVAVLNMQPNEIEVLGVNGDTHLGGEDFDMKLVEFCLSRFKSETGKDLTKLKDSTNSDIKKQSKRCLRRLHTHCEGAKLKLSAGFKATISIDGFYDGEDLVVNVTRQQFEDMNKLYFEKTIELVELTLQELGLSKSDIDDIVLVGGSTRTPKVQQLLKDHFVGKMLNLSIHPDQAVAYGAAVQAAMMNKEKSLMGIRFRNINDVTPMAVGMKECDTNSMANPIPKNSKIPTKRISNWVTAFDDQTAVRVHIFQGNDLKVARNNRWLGSFRLEGIPPKKQGEEQIQAVMEINEMGILHVEAVCVSNQRRSSITITEDKNRMSKDTKKKLLARANAQRTTPGQLDRLSLTDRATAKMGPRDHDIE